MTKRDAVCSVHVHNALKADYEAWSALEFVGYQDCGRYRLELRNCVCGSTLAVEVAKVAA